MGVCRVTNQNKHEQMKTITQRAVAYTAMREDPFTWREYQLMQDAFLAGAASVIDELKTVMAVSEDKYLRENINKMINFLEGKQ